MPARRAKSKDVSGLPPIPLGGPGIPPLQAAAGVGFGEGFAANSHIHSPAGFLPGIKWMVEVAGADVNAVDHDGNTALHHAAARGDVDSILYLVSKGADVTKVNREGQHGRRHGERSGAARAAVARGVEAAREARLEEQPQVRLVLMR